MPQVHVCEVSELKLNLQQLELFNVLFPLQHLLLRPLNVSSLMAKKKKTHQLLHF